MGSNQKATIKILGNLLLELSYHVVKLKEFKIILVVSYKFTAVAGATNKVITHSQTFEFGSELHELLKTDCRHAIKSNKVRSFSLKLKSKLDRKTEDGGGAITSPSIILLLF